MSGPLAEFDVQTFAVDREASAPASRIEQRAYAAYSLRPKIHKLKPQYLKPVDHVRVRRRFAESPDAPEDIAELVKSCQIDHSVRPSTPSRRPQRGGALSPSISFRPSAPVCRRKERTIRPRHVRPQPLSPLRLYFAARSGPGRPRVCSRNTRIMADEFLEELIVRRELAFNFVRYAKRVDTSTNCRIGPARP